METLHFHMIWGLMVLIRRLPPAGFLIRVQWGTLGRTAMVCTTWLGTSCNGAGIGMERRMANPQRIIQRVRREGIAGCCGAAFGTTGRTWRGVPIASATPQILPTTQLASGVPGGFNFEIRNERFPLPGGRRDKRLTLLSLKRATHWGGRSSVKTSAAPSVSALFRRDKLGFGGIRGNVTRGVAPGCFPSVLRAYHWRLLCLFEAINI